MEKQEFLKQQFLSLREEIKDTKSRIFKIMGFGLVVVPAAQFLAQAYKIDTVALSLPFLVIVVALLYLAENNAVIRCGRYLKHHIETEIKEVIGWEEWLETKSSYDTRSVDKYLSYAFHLLFFVYFINSVFLATKFSISSYGMIVTAVILGAYVAIGVWFLIFLFKNIKVSTIVEHDKNEKP
ncbi:MAG: hypothetical protein OEZ39_02120 [Gammaproteobacteria bacterium]|nr:hypothetical protein [Gammaproteobacteria bacterium]MDH5650650.1 hypothetical protein [Gammaproteobacteria bacterium]